jgi:hypothetical protein
MISILCLSIASIPRLGGGYREKLTAWTILQYPGSAGIYREVRGSYNLKASIPRLGGGIPREQRDMARQQKSRLVKAGFKLGYGNAPGRKPNQITIKS